MTTLASIRDNLRVEGSKVFFHGEPVGWAHVNGKTEAWSINVKMGKSSMTGLGWNADEALHNVAKAMSGGHDED